LCDIAPVRESPTIYSVFLEDSQADRTSERVDQPTLRASSSASTGSVPVATGKKNVQQVNKKVLEKKKEKQYTLEDALQQVSL